MARNRIDKNQRAPAGPNSASDTAPRSTRHARGVRRFAPLPRVAIVLVLAGIGVTGFVVWPLWRAALPVTTPKDMQRISLELRTLIERHVAASTGAPRDARQRATLGLVYEANEMWPEALQSFRNATELDPDEPMWPHHAAIAWLETGDLDGATTWLRNYAARFPMFTPLQDRLGALLLEDGRIDEAQAAFEAIIAHAPKSAAGYVGYGDVRLRASDHEGAVAALEKAVRIDPTYKLARYLLGRAYRGVGRMEDAEREMTLGMVAGRNYLTDAWSRHLSKYKTGIGALQERSADFLKAGQPARAVEILERILVEQPDNAASAVNLGIAYLEMNRLEDAEQVLLNAERIDATRFETYINLAACMLRQKRLSNALEYIDRAVELSPTAAQAHLTRGLILMQQRENDMALAALTTSAGLDARNPKVVQELANVCARLGRLPEALEHYRALAKLLPTSWEPHFGTARTLYGMGRLDEALAAANQGLVLAPREPRLLAMARQITGAHNP